jgi:hypothetical protein
MQLVEELDSKTMERLGKQSGFLLMKHEVELAKDPTSEATRSSRSNLMAVQHTSNRYMERRLRGMSPISVWSY